MAHRSGDSSLFAWLCQFGGPLMTGFISHTELVSMLDYEPTTGEFRWLKPLRGCHMRRGDLAGSRHRTGYWIVRVRGRGYSAHRLAWFYAHGTWPDGDIDHKNGNILDNRIENLRCASHSQNMANRKTNVSNQTGFKGVSLSRGRFAAEICVRGERRWLGRFDTAEAAHQAYATEALRGFGEFARAS